ncbi:hypothetical protein ANT_03440 [Candidatus Vecturithrix granuli]|uniref:Thioredoxin domain-containing protein n=1 Tax=Vecturithrix granuli TaxID=1499967 RepID=A0A081BWH6_VECG1|nr:hypothetical protein ANT_03440 [Candidatus Vecturithrix granuli]
MTHKDILFKAGRIMSSTLIVVVMVGLFMPHNAGAAQPPILYLFWGEGCPHCEKEKTFLQDFHQQYPEVELRLFETWQNREFAKLADAVRQTYQIKGASVPLTVMGDWYLVGFSLSGNYSQQIISQTETCLQQGCQDVLDKLGPSAIVGRIRSEAAANAPNGWERYPAVSAPSATGDAHKKIVVFYFHGVEDCPVCFQIEELTHQALEAGFHGELEQGRVEFQRINAELPENRQLVEKYQLTARAVIVSERAQGQEIRWKSLEKIWEFLNNEPAFIQYVQTEITNYLTDSGE